MTEKLKQSLSAVIDDEADAFELRRVLDELDRDPELRAVWDRYHLIGHAMRGEGSAASDDLRERVWAALEREAGAEAVTADERPHPPPAAEAAAAANSSSRRSRLGRFTGLAVAASVAFAVVIGLNGLPFGAPFDDATVASPVASAGTAPVVSGQGAAVPLPDVAPRVTRQLPQPRVRMASEVSPSDVQRAHAYMLHHTQHQAINQPGVMSFVKMATYEAP